MNLTKLLGTFCKHNGLGPLVSDGTGLYRLVFDGRWSVDIQDQHEKSPCCILSCVVGPISATASPAVLRHCLGANLFARRLNDAFVALDKGGDFIGRDALLAARGRPLRKKLVTVVLDDPQAYAWGGEALTLDGRAVGEISSAGWSPRAGACIGLGYLRGAAAQQPHAGTALAVDLWGQPVAARAWDRWPPPA